MVLTYDAYSKTIEERQTKENDVENLKRWDNAIEGSNIWHAELAYSALKLAHGSYTDHYHGCSLALMKEGVPNPISVMDAKLWAEAPFDELWEQQSRPAPQINVSGKDLLNYVKHDRESKEKNQYQ
jgi:hypothetical protein